MKKNKPIVIKCADIYLRFPEIMEEEANDLAEFLEDEHIIYEGATDIVYDLQKQNTELKEDNFKLQARADKYECRINKAVEYIEKESAFLNNDEYEVFNKKDLLDLLKGDKE